MARRIRRRKVKTPKTPKNPARGLSSEKAKKILDDGSVRGKQLTGRQERFFRAVSEGETPRRTPRKKRLKT